MLYNHTNAQIKRIQKTIKKLNQRHTSLTKRGYKNLPQTKEYEELFKKIGGGRMREPKNIIINGKIQKWSGA